MPREAYSAHSACKRVLTLVFLQPHSEVPQRDEDWPSLPNILQYQSRVRERVMNLYRDIESGKITLTRKIARVLFMTLEHEAFHAEVCLTAMPI